MTEFYTNENGELSHCGALTVWVDCDKHEQIEDFICAYAQCSECDERTLADCEDAEVREDYGYFGEVGLWD